MDALAIQKGHPDATVVVEPTIERVWSAVAAAGKASIFGSISVYQKKYISRIVNVLRFGRSRSCMQDIIHTNILRDILSS
jgi:hypothetical protein